MRISGFTKSAFRILIGKGSIAVVTVLFTSYFAHTLQKEVFALLGLYESLTGILMVLTDLGISTAVYKEVPALLRDQKSDEAIREVIFPSSIFRLIVTVILITVITLLLVVFGEPLHSLFPNLDLHFIILCACAAAMLDSVQNITVPVFGVHDKFGTNATITSASTLLENIFAFLFFVSFGMNYYFLGIFAAQVCMLSFRLFYLRDLLKTFFSLSFSLNKSITLFKLYLPFYIRKFFRIGLLQGEQLLVAVLLPLSQFSNFNLAKKISKVVKQYIEAFADPLTVHFARISDVRQTIKAERTFIKFTIPPILVLLFLSPWIVQLFGGDKYADSWIILAVLSFSYIFYALSYMKSSYITIFGENKASLFSDAIGGTVGFFATLVLILLFGANGLAWGQVLSFGSMAVTSHIIARNIHRKLV